MIAQIVKIGLLVSNPRDDFQ